MRDSNADIAALRELHSQSLDVAMIDFEGLIRALLSVYYVANFDTPQEFDNDFPSNVSPCRLKGYLGNIQKVAECPKVVRRAGGGSGRRGCPSTHGATRGCPRRPPASPCLLTRTRNSRRSPW